MYFYIFIYPDRTQDTNNIIIYVMVNVYLEDKVMYVTI